MSVALQSSKNRTETTLLSIIVAHLADLVPEWVWTGSRAMHDAELARRGYVASSIKRELSVMVTGIAFVAVGVLLIAELDTALPTIDNTGLSSDYETTLENFGTGITLVGVAFIVIPAIEILRKMDVI